MFNLLLGIIAFILLLKGHWIWAAIVLFLLYCSCTATDTKKTPPHTDNKTHTPPVANRYPTLSEKNMRVAVYPNTSTDVNYGVSDKEYQAFLNSPNVYGRPASGLKSGGVDAGMDKHNVQAGVAGEVVLAHMLADMNRRGELGDAHVYFSCVNPGDSTGNTDIDCIIMTGSQIWLLDAKHYSPVRPDSYLTPTGILGSQSKAGELYAYDSHETKMDVPASAMARATPLKAYHASGNMAWATDAVKKLLSRPEGITVQPVILLTRTKRGTYGVMEGTEFPGHVEVTTADAWRKTFTSFGPPRNILNDTDLSSLTKSED